jgi:hypothetical protein
MVTLDEIKITFFMCRWTFIWTKYNQQHRHLSTTCLDVSLTVAASFYSALQVADSSNKVRFWCAATATATTTAQEPLLVSSLVSKMHQSQPEE